MTEQGKRKYWRMFLDGWQLFKQFSEMKDNEKDWKKLSDQIHRFNAEHQSRMFERIMLAIWDEMKEVVKSNGQQD
ncbi:MAG TPA: hypothetical protein IAC41_09240 [Candidatus Merdenecus merdavium]|nr:hypothetical protein [Candidatus Merdenecus merdavium]